MKSKIFLQFIIYLISTSTLTTSALAQQTIKTDGAYVNELKVGSKYTEKQIFDALGGNPTKIEVDTEYPDLYIYYYDGDTFYRKGDVFFGCELQSNRFSFANMVKTGNDISVIDNLHGVSTDKKIDSQYYEGAVYWKPATSDIYGWEWLNVIFYYDKNNKIVSITAVVEFI